MANSLDRNFVQLPKPLHDMNEEELRAAFVAIEAANKQRSRSVDYSKAKNFQNAALYTPALSEGYIDNVARLVKLQHEAIEKNDPSLDPFHSLDLNGAHTFGAEDLKFINPNSKLCFYPWVLFSGGQGASTEAEAKKNNWVTTKPRDPRVVVIGDSGGFQLQQQTIPFDPKTTPERMLRWLERIADQSMILDFPTGGINGGTMVPHVQRLIHEGIDIEKIAKQSGFSTGFTACLIRTQQNNDYFQQQRVPGATKLLNVIQGRNEDESAHWYEGIKHYPFEGWAFAGKHSVQLSMTLRRLIQMRDDGLLKPEQWIHFLGVSTMKVGVALTYIQRALRKYTDAKDIQLTFDSKSPVDSMIYGYNAISGYDFSTDKWSIHNSPTNLEAFISSDMPLYNLASRWRREGEDRFLANTTLGHLLKMKDLVGIKNPQTNKRIPNSFQSTLLVHHNTEALIGAFEHAYRYLDDKYTGKRPTSIQFLDTYVDEVFISKNPMDLIDDIEIELDRIALEGHFGK